jgi:hypothetical protein
MRMDRVLPTLVFTLAAAGPSTAQESRTEKLVHVEEKGAQRPYWLKVAEKYGLMPTVGTGPVVFESVLDSLNDRSFHERGDPDSLFTVGGVPAGKTRVAAAVEVNDVIPRTIAPSSEVMRTEGHARPPGDYQPIDALGNPYQLRIGARVLW